MIHRFLAPKHQTIVRKLIAMRWILWLLFFASAYLYGCNHLFYHPTQDIYYTPKIAELEYEEFSVPSRDGFAISTWWIKAVEPSYGTVVHFHGNAQNKSAHFLYSQWMARAGFHVVVFDYRGYGKTPGTPDREGLTRDGTDILEAVVKHPSLGKGQLYVFGQSLGGAVAIASLSHTNQRPWRGFIIDSSFASYRDVARRKLGAIWLTWAFQWPLSFLISDEERPDELAKKIQIPTIVIHGKKDRVVDFINGEELYRSIAAAEKDFWVLPEGHHTSVFADRRSEWRAKTIEWMCSLAPQSTACLNRLAKIRKAPCPFSPNILCES